MRPGRVVLALAGLLSVASFVAAAPRPADLRAPADFARLPEGRERSLALFAEMGKVIQHPRCLNCHPRTDRPTQGDAMVPHSPPVVRGKDGHGAPGLHCSTCHGTANFALADGSGSVPGDPHWHLAPAEMAWVGKSLGEICRQIKDPARNGGKSLDALVKHNTTDSLVGWGWNPGAGREPAPGSQRLFGELTQAWVDAGAHCPD